MDSMFLANEQKFYVRVNEETMSSVLQRHYGDFYKTVQDALKSAYKTMKLGDKIDIVDEFGKVYATTGNCAPESV
jgi:hypothetical protein